MVKIWNRIQYWLCSIIICILQSKPVKEFIESLAIKIAEEANERIKTLEESMESVKDKLHNDYIALSNLYGDDYPNNLKEE